MFVHQKCWWRGCWVCSRCWGTASGQQGSLEHPTQMGTARPQGLRSHTHTYRHTCTHTKHTPRGHVTRGLLGTEGTEAKEMGR